MTTASRVRLRLVGDERLVASVRCGDAAAFEALYDRHATELLSFCVYMLGSRHDAEDAVQATFAAAYRHLRADRRTVTLRPWLFAIARNNCLSTLRRRRPWVELNGEAAIDGDPLRELELREEVRLMIAGLRSLPESQRASLILAELHGFSQAEIGDVLGVEAGQVKAFICQARSNLVSERSARETDCREIREELATARGAALLRGRLRRHLRSCDDCRTYADGVASQRRHLALLLPLAPSLLLKYRALEEALGTGVVPTGYAGGTAVGGAVAGTAAEVAGGGFKALALKIAAGIVCLGTGAGAGASVLTAPSSPPTRPSISSTASSGTPALATASVAAGARTGRTALRPSAGPAGGGGAANKSGRSSSPAHVGWAPSGNPGTVGSRSGEGEQRRQEREQRTEERRLANQDAHRLEREQQGSAPGAKAPAEPRREQRERVPGKEPRTPKTEAERQQSREERAASVRWHPKRTKEERQLEREENAPEKVAGQRGTEAEKLQAKEERKRRREAKEAEAPSE